MASVNDIIVLIRSLTWRKLLQVFVLLLVLLFFGTLYMFKQDIYEWSNLTAIHGVGQLVKIEPSSETKLKINETADKFPAVVAGIQIVNVNFRNNTRTSAYFAINEPNLKQASQDYQQSSLAASPIFNDDETNNQRIVSLINGDFICTPFKHSLAAQIYPKAINSVNTICSVGIPPHYGKFSGYLNIYLISKPDKLEIGMIRRIAIDLSGTIYSNDILHENTKARRPRGGV